jgi:hypothetical protein
MNAPELFSPVQLVGMADYQSWSDGLSGDDVFIIIIFMACSRSPNVRDRQHAGAYRPEPHQGLRLGHQWLFSPSRTC